MITNAVSTQVWSGDAVVHVSIVNWIKGKESGMKKLAFQRGDAYDSPFEYYELDHINSALSIAIDLTSAKPLTTNKKSQACYQGQTHGHKGFLIKRNQAEFLLEDKPEYHNVLFPFLTSDEMLGKKDSRPTRYVIDFRKQDIFAAQKFPELLEQVKSTVMPNRKQKAEDEEKRNQALLAKNPKSRVNHHHKKFYKNWWKLSWDRDELMKIIETLPRYCVCGQVTKRPIFEFVSKEIHPNAALVVFPLADDYTFGILQSSVHWEWFSARCSTLKGDPRYTSNTVFDTFPWPQHPTENQVKAIAEAAYNLRTTRRKVTKDSNISLRELYRIVEETPSNPVSEAQEKLDEAVMSAYGMKKSDDILAFLLALNLELAEKEARGEKFVGPGLPPFIDNSSEYITDDCIKMK